MANENKNIPSMMTDDTPEARVWRREQAHVDADIEGLADSPIDSAFEAELDRLNLTTEERIARWKNHFTEQNQIAGSGSLDAAE